MQRDLMLAQSATLKEWAELWAREDEEGRGEVGYLLARAARLIKGVAGEVVEEEEPLPPELPFEVAEVREG